MRLVSALAICCAFVAAGPAAAAAPTLPQLTSFSVTSVRFHGTGIRLGVAGSLDCTRHADFHLNLWVYQHGTGALARTSIPSPRGPHPTKKRLARLRRLSACRGSTQSWSAKASAAPTGAKHRSAFTAGPAEVCAVIAVGKSRRYTLQSNCVNVTIARR